ncbi:MAG: hypothetical protein ACE5KM_09925 [Planctomycetaceae bacterium]
MIPKSRYTEAEWQQRSDKILAALARAREHAKQVTHQTGTPLIDLRDGDIMREYVTESANQQTATEE